MYSMPYFFQKLQKPEFMS